MNARSLIRHIQLGMACAGLSLMTLIAACGGAIGSGGTGAAPPTLSGGTVTGFGSVIVDGLRFDDRSVATVAQTDFGTETPTEARMGHRVEVEFDTAGNARTLRVEASVTGSVTSASVTGPGAGSFVVLGQTVTVNADARAGPVTQFGSGYGSALDVNVGDAVEVHGAARPIGGGMVIQATRIEKMSASPATLRVGGIVGALGEGGAGRFTLGSLTVDAGTASLTPTGATLVNGASVLVFAPAANLAARVGANPVLTASAVRVKPARAAGTTTYASGFVTSLDAAQGLFKLNGTTVKYNPADVQPLGTLLANGQYVQARGGVMADGSLLATSIKLRDGRSEPEAELKGTVVGFNATSSTFKVRDVSVSIPALGTEVESCPGTGLRDGLFVELEGTLGPTGVIARKIECKDAPAGAVIERKGVASAVNLAGTSFTLTAVGEPPVKVVWTSLTFFRTVTPQTLAGMTVEVEGALVNGELQATKVKVDD